MISPLKFITKESVQELRDKYGKTEQTVAAYVIRIKFFQVFTKRYVLLLDPDHLTKIELSTITGEPKDIQVYPLNEIEKLKIGKFFFNKTITLKPNNGKKIKFAISLHTLGLENFQHDFFNELIQKQIY